MSTIKKVLVVFAMEAEAMPFINHMALKMDEPAVIAAPAPCVTFSGQASGMDLHVVWNGKCATNAVDNVGTVPAALASYLAIQAFKPDVVISAGTAGGFKSQGAAIGDIFISSSLVHHDRRIPIPGFDAYGVGHAEAVPTPKLQASLGFKQGVVSSGNSLDYTEKCMEIMTSKNVAIKEMEAAAIAWVCGLFETPFFGVKSVTDIVDGDKATQDEFMENLSAAAQSLQANLPKVLEFMAGKTISEL
eukprot:gene20726-27541_t